jgi:hypothetical protein
MGNYGAQLLAAVRRAELTAAAAESRLAAAARERTHEQLPAPLAGRRYRSARPAAA